MLVQNTVPPIEFISLIRDDSLQGVKALRGSGHNTHCFLLPFFHLDFLWLDTNQQIKALNWATQFDFSPLICLRPPEPVWLVWLNISKVPLVVLVVPLLLADVYPNHSAAYSMLMYVFLSSFIPFEGSASTWSKGNHLLIPMLFISTGVQRRFVTISYYGKKKRIALLCHYWGGNEKSNYMCPLGVQSLHSTEAITMCHQLTVNKHSIGDPTQRLWLARSISRWLADCGVCLWPVLPDRDCLIQRQLSFRSGAPGCSSSAPLHTRHISSQYTNFQPHKCHLLHRIIPPPSLAAQLGLATSFCMSPRLLDGPSCQR